ncbi:MAG: GNAT family N-acetyltransferase [Gammaproteobacteria bacterium]|nr:GNAT family N-acetyltransferase [Gammaproteobacteria bacterium]
MQEFLIKNEQIGLSAISESDRPRFFYLQQDVEINKYIRVPQADPEVEKFFQALIRPWSEEENAWHGFGVRRLDDDDLMGLAFYRYKNKLAEVLEIGWKMHPDVWGKGLATHAATLLMRHLSSKYPVHKYVAYCDAGNAASERIMQKLGMQKEGHFKSDFKIGDEWRDDVAYGLVLD